MKYADNILKTEAAYYTFNNATISNSTLIIQAGGSATQHITIKELPAVTDTMLFRCIVDNYSDRYIPTVSVLIHVRNTETQQYDNIQIFPIYLGGGTFVSIFNILSGLYDDMYVTISSSISTRFTIWELCPEAADEDTKVLIDGVKQSLPKLLYDYNTTPMTVQQQEAVVAFITCRLLAATDLQGHFVITFFSAADCTITVRFYDNDAEELFAPLYYDVNTGRNTIGIPHAYLQRKAGIHSFIVTMQAEAGQLTVDTRGCLFTIDGGYLAVRALDIALDVTDIAIRQLSSDSGPDQIWVVGIDGGEALIRYRGYNESNANVGWNAAGKLGSAIHAAIEFDGDWVLRIGAGQYTIDTEEDPYIFIVDENHNLYAYHGIEDTDPVLLDTGVVFVKACKGYSSIDYPDQDQGLIVAYIKESGSVWYRQLTWNVENNQKYWLAKECLRSGSWNYVNVSRLNDYRVSFQLSDDEKNLWLYTERMWVGQAMPPEIFSIANGYEDHDLFVAPADFTRDVHIDECTTTSEYDDNLNKYVWTVLFHFSRTVHFRGTEEAADYCTLTNDLLTNAQSIEYDSENNSIKVTLWMNDSPADVTVVYGNFTIASSDGIFVAEYPYGSANIGTVRYYWEVSNANRINVDYTEELLAYGDTSPAELGYRFNTYKNIASTETFNLGADAGSLRFGIVDYTDIAIPKETLVLCTDSTLNSLTYTGTHVSPI